jgi:DNA-binding NarL/FixJ family response regulator
VSTEEPPITPVDSPITTRRIRVGVVDDHPSIVAALSAAVASATDLELIGSAADLASGMALASTVDVLVTDVQLGGHAEGLDILAAVQATADPPAVLVLSGFGQTSVVRTAIERGAAGYLDKSADVATIVDAIRTIAGGGTIFSAVDLRASQVAPRRPSDRELQVIGLVVGGATNAEVGANLDLSEKTVESHLRRLFDRYGLLSRTELAVLALEEGWAAPPRRT